MSDAPLPLLLEAPFNAYAVSNTTPVVDITGSVPTQSLVQPSPPSAASKNLSYHEVVGIAVGLGLVGYFAVMGLFRYWRRELRIACLSYRRITAYVNIQEEDA